MKGYSYVLSSDQMKHTIYQTEGKISKKGVIFLDRDGVIIKEKHYLNDADQVELHDGSYELFRLAENNNIGIVIVTNQSGISRGFFDWTQYISVSARMLELLDHPTSILAVYANGYKHNECERKCWRKPNPGMMLQACEDFNIEVNNSAMIGDRLTDLISAARAGVRTVFHVETGYGQNELIKIKGINNDSWKSKYGCNKPMIRFYKSIKDVISPIASWTSKD